MVETESVKRVKEKAEVLAKIKEKTNWTSEEFEQRITNKINEYQGLIDRNVALSMIAKDLKIKNEKSEEIDKPIIQTADKLMESKEPLSLAIREDTEIVYPSEEILLFQIRRRDFIKKKLIDEKEDVIDINGKNFLKASGTQKYINGFGISIDVLSLEVVPTENDVEAICKVKAIAPNGQFVIAEGTKAKSEYWSEKYQNYGSYSKHNIKATARTRAIHCAVKDLVGYGELSFEDLSEADKRELSK